MDRGTFLFTPQNSGRNPPFSAAKVPVEPPWLVLDLTHQNVRGHCRFHVEWLAQVMNMYQVDVMNIVCAVTVLDLAASPAEAFNISGFAVCDASTDGNLMQVPACLWMKC